MDLISVIIPVYNNERFVKACCSSIIRQTYRNIEIIVIDDGSNDNSYSIVQKIGKSDNRIHIVRSNHTGVSAARNIGLNQANGKYLCFVDSDDLLATNAIEILYKRIIEDNSDYCQGSIMGITALKNYSCHLNYNISGDINNYDIYQLLLSNMYWGPVAGLYRNDIIKNKSLCFPQNIQLAEDSIFLAKYIQACTRISTASDYVYYYNRENLSSATHKGYNDAWKWLLEFTKEYSNIFPDEYLEKKSAVEEMAIRNIKYTYTHYISNCMYLGQKTIEEYLSTAYDHFLPYLNELNINGLRNLKSIEFIYKYKMMLEKKAYEEIFYSLNPNDNTVDTKKLQQKVKGILKQLIIQNKISSLGKKTVL